MRPITSPFTTQRPDTTRCQLDSSGGDVEWSWPSDISCLFIECSAARSPSAPGTAKPPETYCEVSAYGLRKRTSGITLDAPLAQSILPAGVARPGTRYHIEDRTNS